MQCSTCGTQLDRSGQGHTCSSAAAAPVAPPTGWVVLTWITLAFAGLFVAGALFVAQVELGLPADPAELTAGQRVQALVVTATWVLVLVGAVVSQLLWNRRTRRLAEQYGFDGRLVIRGWFLRVYAASIFASFLAPLLGLAKDETVLVVTGVRVVGGLLLVANVVIGRVRLRRVIEDSARQSEQSRNRPAAAPEPAPGERDLEELWDRLKS